MYMLCEKPSPAPLAENSLFSIKTVPVLAVAGAARMPSWLLWMKQFRTVRFSPWCRIPAPLLPSAEEMAAPESSKFSMVALAVPSIVKIPFCCAGVTPVMSIFARPFTPVTVSPSVDHAHVFPVYDPAASTSMVSPVWAAAMASHGIA